MNKSGGSQGVFDKLRANWLGAEVGSWLAPGGNLPLNLQQVLQVFGKELIQSMSG